MHSNDMNSLGIDEFYITHVKSQRTLAHFRQMKIHSSLVFKSLNVIDRRAYSHKELRITSNTYGGLKTTRSYFIRSL